MTYELSAKKVFITGASSGIGLALAREVHAQGAEVCLVARRRELLIKEIERLNAIRPGSATILVTDLGTTEGCHLAESYLRETPCDLLVNNVGRGSSGLFETIDIDLEEAMVRLNCIAPLRLTHAVIPGMKARGSGAIIFISSVAGYQPLPYMSTYSASKAFNLYQSLSLREELKAFNIRVLAVCPGPVATEFNKDAKHHGKGFSGGSRDAAETVAQESIAALKRDLPVLFPGKKGRKLGFMARMAPFTITARIAGNMMRKIFVSGENHD